MKWLIVAFGGRKEDVEHMRHFLEHYDTTITVFGAGSCPEKDFLSAVAECEYCIWLGDTEGAGQEGGAEACPAELSFAFGYVLGKDMPVFCVRKEGARHWHQSPLTTNEYHEYTSCSDLLSVLESRFPDFLVREKQKRARHTLLDAGIPFNPDSFAFHIASDNEKECDLFIDAGIDVNSRDAAGTPMICIAARHNRREMIERLLVLGADINAVSKDRGYSAVMDAVWKSNTEIVEFLVEKGANLGYISRDGQPVLVLAVGTGNEKVCRILAEHGADPFLCDAMGMSALSYAKLFKKESLVPIFEARRK
ncbi:MAG: ankyrin repeat domain-containing protein [Spirochaetaceae bacterium]|nr:ankyrin repeat domain-containing protein [Spirochaetaceae bacterium]